MIKLKIKRLVQSPNGGDQKEVEDIIDFDGTVEGKFITHTPVPDRFNGLTVTWCPMMARDGWEVIKEIK